MTKLSDFEKQNGSEDYSKNYKVAIAKLAEKLNNSGILKDVDLAELVKSQWLWDDLVAIKPEVQKLAYEVEEEIDYELSFNQCCNAVNWVYLARDSVRDKYSKESWEHLL